MSQIYSHYTSKCICVVILWASMYQLTHTISNIAANHNRHILSKAYTYTHIVYPSKEALLLCLIRKIYNLNSSTPAKPLMVQFCSLWKKVTSICILEVIFGASSHIHAICGSSSSPSLLLCLFYMKNKWILKKPENCLILICAYQIHYIMMWV